MNNKDKIILHLCADMGSDSLPYKEAGYDVRLIGSKIGVENYNPSDNVYGIIANPVCTMFSIARTTAKTPRDLREGMVLIKECLRVIWECQYRTNDIKQRLRFWVIENPATGYLKYFLGKPAFVYKQSEYGGWLNKPTALWGDFNIPQRPILSNPIPPRRGCGNEWGKMNSEQKSKCPYNFAKAFYEANK